MKHLSAEEIISYVTMDEMNEASLGFCKNVTGHIRGCSACLGKLRKYLDIHDVYKTQNPGGDFKAFATELLQEESPVTMDMN
ncbi:MAG: hypothetical protein IKU07_01405 [Oscillospiraceae bacterium]|nr:hypothetical protein [Oscillospiraceae bacterium]